MGAQKETKGEKMKVNYILTRSLVSDIRNPEKSGTVSKYRNYVFLKNKTETNSKNNNRIEAEYVIPIEELSPLNNYEISLSLENSYTYEGNEIIIESGYTCVSVEFNSFYNVFGENDSTVDCHFHKILPNNKYSTILVHDIGDILHPEFVVGKHYTLVIK